MNEAIPMLGPVIALVLWTHVMWFWMYATRIPAIQASKMVLDPNAKRGDQMATLPPHVRWKADNFNHLMEEPTLFYAVALTLAALHDRAGATIGLAWAYVGLRVAHSLLQSLVNRIEVRFTIFVLSSSVLMALTVRAAIQVFGL